MSKHLTLSFLLFFFLILCDPSNGRFITHSTYFSLSSDLVSDGVQQLRGQPYLALNRSSSFSDESTCEQTYGFLPCTTTILGNIFLILVYDFLMYLSATCLSYGSEHLLKILGPAIVGGLFLPILGALPDAMLILVSGLSGSTKTAESQVSVGMGLLAGSTILFLTIIWGICIIVGKCNLVDGVAQDLQDTNSTESSACTTDGDVTTHGDARPCAWIMLISVIPFLIIQIPQVLSSTLWKHLAVWIALIFSLLLLISYCLYQVFEPWIHKSKISSVMHKWQSERLLNDLGEPDEEGIKRLFSAVDTNRDGKISHNELRALVLGIRFEEIDLNKNDAVDKLMRDFDTSQDGHINKKEFVDGVSERLKRATNIPTTSIKAVLLLLLGTLIAVAFADPLVEAVDNFADATSIPSFFVSFIALPLATNLSEVVSAVITASRHKGETANLTFTVLYGSVIMNNVLCLSVFLALVNIRGLAWDFSSEVLVIIIVCVVVGCFASFSKQDFPKWTALVAFLLYPLSLVLIYVLRYVLDWP
ncbi:sodium/calcium exchanger NCL-like [Carya illinoinensis]|uniref:EF-hand domain-containing protein n=1 Tax=Carya illinoinensis TaxID=32201 RepID=A0A8T1P601_CARIL|nr:sodium/calcium exchanger NCL-like [Carya illinoinensis]KAG6637224.1 hypothetical protein CIPAW_11G164100 [Carya illinoinensis]